MLSVAGLESSNNDSGDVPLVYAPWVALATAISSLSKQRDTLNILDFVCAWVYIERSVLPGAYLCSVVWSTVGSAGLTPCSCDSRPRE